VSRRECPGGTFAVHAQGHFGTIDNMFLDLGDIMGDVVNLSQPQFLKGLTKNFGE
jgi:hypothetical protein